MDRPTIGHLKKNSYAFQSISIVILKQPIVSILFTDIGKIHRKIIWAFLRYEILSKLTLVRQSKSLKVVTTLTLSCTYTYPLIVGKLGEYSPIHTVNLNTMNTYQKNFVYNKSALPLNSPYINWSECAISRFSIVYWARSIQSHLKKRPFRTFSPSLA